MTVDAGLHRLSDELREQARQVTTEVPFSREEYAARKERALAAMREAGLDLLLMSSPESMYYLHGYRARWYRGHSPRVWPPLSTTVLDARSGRLIHFDQDEEEVLLRATSIAEDVRLYKTEDLDGCVEFLTAELGSAGLLPARIGTEQWSYQPNHAVAQRIDAALTAAGGDITDASGIIRGIRLIKSGAELAYMEEAARICDRGIEAARDALTEGITELELWAEMMRAMARAGGEPAALHELVKVDSVGQGHAIASRRKIRRGELVRLDPCGVVNRYHANVSATLCIGDPPDDAQRAMAVAAGGFDVLCDVARDGVPVGTANRALREYYEAAGIWQDRGWVGGYELGASFPPDWVGEFVFSVDEIDPPGEFRAGMVTNYESIFVCGGMIDTVVYGTGPARTLSAWPKEIAVR